MVPEARATRFKATVTELPDFHFLHTGSFKGGSTVTVT